MSTVVPILTSEALQEDLVGKRKLLRRRLILAAVTVFFIAGLAAVPIPARRAFEQLLGEIAELEDSVQSYRDEERKLAEWASRIGAEPQDLAARAELWLSATDPIELRNRLIAVAGPCGLALAGVAVEEGVEPLADDEVMDSLRMVLGTVTSEGGGDGAWDDDGDPWGEGGGASHEPDLPVLSATRYTISGHGPVSGVVLFSGLLRQLPEPLRMLSLDLTLDEEGARFTLVADRLACPISDELSEGVS